MAVVAVQSGKETALAALLPLRAGLNHLVVALRAYLDESGTGRPARAMSIAGYVSTRQRWERFERLWADSLHAYGIEFFHMSPFMASPPRKQFQGWPDRRRWPRLQRLVSLLNRHVLVSIGVVVLRADYEAIFATAQERRRDGLYKLIAVHCMDAVRNWQKDTGRDEEVSYVFESGAEGAGALERVFVDAQRRPGLRDKFRLGTFAFDDKRRVAALQAADIAAWTLHHELPRGVPRPPGIFPEPVIRLLRRGLADHRWHYMSREHLTRLRGELRKVDEA